MVDWTAALWIGSLLCRPEGDEEKEGPVFQSQVTNAGELARKECVSGVTRSGGSYIRVGEHAPRRGRAGELEHSSAAGRATRNQPVFRVPSPIYASESGKTAAM